ncbi:MAG: glycosyltransferase family 4 protein [Devosia sp.]|uniref:glycosyltransferase family 4 protein n=1 Tax=Devosia sp. TaxID=1871048 RepID=UPI0024CA65F2|nr:glycosyltransferase family 4 protein [Devosia sp.]UYN99985.1 MAG: glycosyltransferase family 4 protein [Devosia sp.]
MAEKPMRILQVMRAPVGGLFRHVADLTRALSARGHSIGLIVDTLANDGQTESRLAELEPHAALGIHRYPMPRVLGRGDLTTPFAVSGLARRLDIDIMHGHGAKGGFYARLAKLAGARAEIFYTPHGGVLHFDPRGMSGRLFHALERRLMGFTNTIIFESAFAGEAYSRLIAAPSCRSAIIHNGLVDTEFEPVTIRPDAADFVFVGELRALKGIFPLVEALAPLKRPDGTPATLVMAGDGPDRAELETRLEQAGLTKRVTLLGSRPAREAFAQARCAVVPSLAESLPYIVLEAAAAGLPVITTGVGGIPEIFGPYAQRLIPAGDPEALRAAMGAVLAAPDAAIADMQLLRARVSEHFSVGRMTEAIAGLYRGDPHKDPNRLHRV